MYINSYNLMLDLFEKLEALDTLKDRQTLNNKFSTKYNT